MTRRDGRKTGEVLGERGEGEAGASPGEKIEFDISVRFSLAARARVKISACFHPPSRRVRNEDFLSARPPGLSVSLPTVFSSCDPPSRVKGGGGRVEGDEDENAENGRNAKWQLWLDIRRPARRKLSERPHKKPATELFKSRPSRPPPSPFFRVPPFYSPGRFSRGNLISPSAARGALKSSSSGDGNVGRLPYDETYSPLVLSLSLSLFSHGRNAFNWPWPGSLKENLRRGPPGRDEIENEKRCAARPSRI